MKIGLKQNTNSLLGGKDYVATLDKTPIFLIQKSLMPFSDKYIVREWKNKTKVGKFEGDPYDSEYGAILTLRRQEVHIDKVENNVYKAEWQNATNKKQLLKRAKLRWSVYEDDLMVAEWSYNRIVKFGQNRIELSTTKGADILPIIMYATVFDIYRLKASLNFG